MEDPKPESIRLAMDQAWRDHHHARDQTWKAVQIEAMLAVGLVGIDVQFQNLISTVAVGALVIIASVFGILISLHHRRLEIRKFTHIMNCEDALGLRGLISGVKLPKRIRFCQVFRFRVHNTALFILRMHVAIIIFATVFTAARCLICAGVI